MGKNLDLKYTLGCLTIAGIIGGVLSWFSALPFWGSFLIVVAAMVLNGILAEHEDNLPGGFNNPMSKEEIMIENERKKKP